ncbi:MAG: OmpA family protein [Bacteroidales bacterium]|nr:OmpA family protein [Bacteroidales bacterium]
MKTLFLIILFGLFSNICNSQIGAEIIEKRNIYNKKGDYYYDRNEFKQAIFYYNLAYKKDTSDYFSILKKAEAYNKLKLYPQAEECFHIVFNANLRVNNAYRLKYALVLLENNKVEEFKYWLNEYSQVVEAEIKSENYLVSSENRIQLYKDTSIVSASDTLKFKIKYEGYKYRRRSDEEKQIFIILSNGDDYTINASETDDFKFSFQPMEDYKLIIQHEDILAEDVLANDLLSPAQRKSKFLMPPPIQTGELQLEKGMKYQFSSGKYKITPEYLNTVNELKRKYQSPDANTVDLTALVKELQLAEGDIYTIRFANDVDPNEAYKKLEVSILAMNDRTVNIYGQSFMVVLPDRPDENFAIQTDTEELEKNFSPKKHSIHVDDKPLFITTEEKVDEEFLSLMVNTEMVDNVSQNRILTANEISIIPGTEYLLTLSKPDPFMGENIEVFVPLTKGVKYNLTSNEVTSDDYKTALAEFLTGRSEVKLTDEEIIDISVLSKELEVKPGEEVSFSLLPVKKFGKQPTAAEEIISSLTVDEKVFEISQNDKYIINVPFTMNSTVNLQTDLEYLQENFEPEAFTVNLDTFSFISEITVDTTGYGALRSSGWLSMSVNTDSIEEVEQEDRFFANEVSIIPGNEYILTITKIDALTKEKDEIIIPLLRQVKYDFTSNPESEDMYRESLKEFMAGREDIEASDGTLIDITMLSKELQIEEDDEISFSLLPVRKLTREPTPEVTTEKSSLYLDNKVVEFNYIHKYTINIPLNENREVNVQTNVEHLQENFDPSSFTVNVDTTSCFAKQNSGTLEEVITDPVFDVVIVNFDLNEHILTPGANSTILEKVVNELKDDSRLYVTIKGYTDGLGDASYNLNLSRRRAESVKEFLKENGIGEKRIRTFSFGESQALKEGVNWEDLSEEELRKQRKVEIVIYLPE